MAKVTMADIPVHAHVYEASFERVFWVFFLGGQELVAYLPCIIDS